MLEHSPSFTEADAERIAARHFGRRGPVRPLTSERDQNFLVEDASGAIVLKIANALEERALLKAQQEVLARLAGRGLDTPRVVCTTSGEALVELAGAGGRRHYVWAITRLRGVLLAEIGHRSAELLEALG